MTLVSLAEGVLSTSPPARALKREGEALAKLDHPNIVRLYELREEENQIWLVLEHLEGTPLSSLVHKKLSLEAICAIGLDLARALAHAHKRGLLHGHLQIDCIEISSEGRTKLGGFGHAEQTIEGREALTPDTPSALSPEATVGRATSELSDLFALGCLLYELIATEPPFGPPTDPPFPERVRNDSPRPLLAFRERIPGSLLLLIDECLEKSPSRRPESAEVVAARLEEVVGPSTMHAIARELLKVQALSDPEDRSTDHSLKNSLAPEKHRMRRRVFGVKALLLSCVVGALGSVSLYSQLLEPSKPENLSSLDRTPEPSQAALLRVIASPWAHVLVDGVHVETTPFAQPITLAPGAHLVRLEHPHAPAEERPIHPKAGEAVLLNVKMHVKAPVDLGPSSAPPEETTP